MAADDAHLLPPEVIARLQRLRLVTRRRVQGRFAGGHTSRRYGSSLDFADHREYVAGDDPRRIDLAAYQRLGRLLVKLYEAEDEAAIRIVVDLSASMGFGRKGTAARQVAACFAALAANAQDRVRLVLVTAGGPDVGPWFRGPGAYTAVETRLRAADPDAPDRPDAADDDVPPPAERLVSAVRRAAGEGPAGPVVLISDLLVDGWEEVVRALAAVRGDGLLVQVLGREDLDPGIRGDLRLVDSETGTAVEVGVAEDALASYVRTRDDWLAAVAAACGGQAVAYARLVDDEPVVDLVTSTLRRLGVVA